MSNEETRYNINRYGITHDQYLSMSKKQGNVCAICGNPETTYYKKKLRRLAVDHCHTTGKIRGLLCNRCNTGIGFLKDNPVVLEKAAAYLRLHGK